MLTYWYSVQSGVMADKTLHDHERLIVDGLRKNMTNYVAKHKDAINDGSCASAIHLGVVQAEHMLMLLNFIDQLDPDKTPCACSHCTRMRRWLAEHENG